mgnify:FL=1
MNVDFPLEWLPNINTIGIAGICCVVLMYVIM